MTQAPTTTKGYVLNAAPDLPDIRDQIFQPSLQIIPEQIVPNINDLMILDQGQEGACTGFGLAAAVNLQRRFQLGDNAPGVSARMLYEMAKRNDEWTGEDYEGSSIRGALRGFYNNGVCSDVLWRYSSSKAGKLTIERARDARNVALGAYYRVRPDIAEIHAAINEAGVVYASARVHDGWFSARGGVITPKPLNPSGGHAFAIIGYTDAGFIIQNSWSTSWGRGGTALWMYEDWAESVSDAWVMRLGAPTPKAFDLRSRGGFGLSAAKSEKSTVPRRMDIAGHFAHLDDGKFNEVGRYHSDISDVRTTFDYLEENSDKFPKLLLFAHGGLNSPKSSATRIAAMKKTFKDNGIYPFHFMYDTGLVEELKDVIFGKSEGAADRAGFISGFTDRVIERLSKRVGSLVWDEMKSGAEKAFSKNGSGTAILKEIAKRFGRSQIEVHIVAHSLGSVFMGHLLARAAQMPEWKLPIKTLTLFAPACRTEFFTDKYRTRLTGSVNAGARIQSLQMQCLTDERELDDNVGAVYRKSLLYLVSNAFERPLGAPILGMEKFHAQENLDLTDVDMVYAGRSKKTVSDSDSHGGFDNDPASMNTVLKRVLNKSRPPHLFTEENLKF